MLETRVDERHSKKYKSDRQARIDATFENLRETNQLTSSWDIPDAAAPLDLTVNLSRRTVEVGMLLKAPLDRVSTKARLNWVLRQLKGIEDPSVHIRLLWPGRNDPTQRTLAELREDPECASQGMDHLSAHGFYVFSSHRPGQRFLQQVNFITDLEKVVPDFYRDVGSNLIAWKKPPPKVKSDRKTSQDVSTSALSEDSSEFSE